MAVQSNHNSTINPKGLPYRAINSPSSELLEFVINQIYSDSLFQLDFYSMIYHYGIPRVNWATIDINSETNYVISIPLMKNDKITSYIFYSAFLDYYQISFQPLFPVFDKLNNNDFSGSYSDHEKLALIKYSNTLFLTEGKYCPIIYEWIDLQSAIINPDESYNRTAVNLNIEFIKVHNYGWNSDVYYHEFGLTIECADSPWTGWAQPGDGGGGGGGGNSGGGGSSSGTGNPPENEDIPNIEFIEPNHINKDCYGYSFSLEAIEELLSIANGITRKCPYDQSPSDEVNSILENLCDSPQGGDNAQVQAALANINGDIVELSNTLIDRDMIRDEFAGEEDYIYFFNLVNSCPKLNCILDNLISSYPSNDGGLCSEFIFQLLEPFFSEGLNLQIGSAPFIGGNENAQAFTTISLPNELQSSSEILILFRDDYCNNSNAFSLYETFLHELVHADISRRLIVDFGLTNLADVENLFQELLEQMGYDGQNWDDQHQLMLVHYIDQMANALWLANGSQGELGWYYGYILGGFPEDLILKAYPEFESVEHLKSAVAVSQALIDEIHHEKFTECD